MKKFISILLIMVLCLTAIPMANANAATIKINKKNLVLTVGETFTLQIKNTNRTIKWTSDNKESVKISKGGIVSAIYPGDALITAKVGGNFYYCTVNVEPQNKNILLYEDDYLALSYMNMVDGNIYFKISNKTDEKLSVLESYIVINEISYDSSYGGTDIIPNSSKTYIYESDIENDNISKLSGSFGIYATDGGEIETIEFKDIAIK